jgi:choline dehydrogenase-like flavoprotein
VMRRTYDFIIAGLGVSGLALLRELIVSELDFSALVLEREQLWNPEDSHQSPETWHAYRLTSENALHRASFSEGAVATLHAWWTSRRAGGGFNRWYGQMSRFEKADFDGSFGRPWPISLETLEPWYDAVEKDLLPFGCSYGYTADQYAKLDCRYFANRQHASQLERRCIDALLDSGIGGFVGQSCLGGRVWEESPVDPRLLVPIGGHPLLARPNYYMQVMRRIAVDPRFEVVGMTEMVRFERRSGRRATVVHVRAEGRRTSVRTEALVLACGPLNSVPILMESDLPDKNRALGKGLTFTLERVAYGLMDMPHEPTPLDRAIGRFSSTVVKSFYLYGDGVRVKKGGKFSIYDAKEVELLTRRRRQLELAGVDVEEFLTSERDGRQSVKISYKGESEVSDTKSISMVNGRAVVNYHPAVGDQNRHEAVEAQIRSIATALGVSALHLQPIPGGKDLVSAHHHGGAVASVERRGAVLSADCESLEAPGVFVVDGSFMPTSGGTNSSLTVMANARRVGSVLLTRFAEDAL